MIYSPSRGGTQDFQRCPRLYDLSKRWDTEREWRPEMAIGNAIHAVLANVYLGKLDEVNVADYWQDSDEAMPMETAAAIVTKCAREALKIELVGDSTVVAVEREMGPERCHPDLVIQHGDWLQVIDWKFSLTLKPEWVSKRLAGYETLWQLWHYAWRVQQEFALPCNQITVVQMAGLPKAFARRVDYEVT